MKKIDVLLTMASWEERFEKGFIANLEYYSPAHVITYFVDRYSNWTEEVRSSTQALCAEKHISNELHELSVDTPTKNWNKLKSSLSIKPSEGNNVVVDLTTMTRETIWLICWFLEYKKTNISYVYHSPKSYSKEWLSRDPQKPRLIYKLSGIPRIGSKTALVILAGYDPERTAQLINHFEPSLTFLGIQSPNYDQDNEDHMNEQIRRFSSDATVKIFNIDAYSPDHGQAAIESQIIEILESHNIIMSSLGPKPTSIALYRIQRNKSEIGLAYAPSREFNRDYSTGIGNVIRGNL